ncbi:hypothetical protein GF312_09690 [Candidatus Poribacteria bacterium]|nr:hypothetical protein [Candidatus Poribacteria bacterium]
MKKLILAMTMFMLFSTLAFGATLYVSDFESDALDAAPEGWELGFVGSGEGKVIVDPLDAGNKIFAHTDLPEDQARHDVGGNIWTVGEDDWQDYVVEYDVYFPADFYIGVLFRFMDENSFYLMDRRIGGAPEEPTFDFWKQMDGEWTNLFAGAAFGAAPEAWYRFRLVVQGNTFTAYAKPKDDSTPFDEMNPLMEATDDSFTAGKFGLYGLIYIDNIAIGETVEDVVTAVEPVDKLGVTWGEIKK